MGKLHFAKHSIIGLLTTLVGCAVGPDYMAPEAPHYTEYTSAKQTEGNRSKVAQEQTIIIGQDIPAQWWQVFHSPALDSLIRQGLINSPTLAKAKARIKQAQEDFTAQVGSFYPIIDGNASITREKINFESLGISAFPSPPPFTLYNIGTTVSYTLDVFGKNRRELEALCAQIDYEQYELAASQLTLVGNIVTAAIKSASLREQIKSTHEIIKLQEEQLIITEQRYKSGSVAQLDILNQGSQLAQLQATLSPLQKQLDQTNNLLAIYIGKAPSEVEIPPIYLHDLQLPNTLPLSLPARLVKQRPDIRAAEALLHQASANVGVATADLYPLITITGSFASEATAIEQLLSASSYAWNIGPALLQPIFHGGTLRAKKRSAVAAYEQAVAAYQEAVLQGMQNVADALRAIEHDAKTYHAKQKITKQNEDIFHITSSRYQAGGVSQVALLDAQRQYYQARLDEIQSTADRYADSAALFQALGGGWWQNECQSLH